MKPIIFHTFNTKKYQDMADFCYSTFEKWCDIPYIKKRDLVADDDFQQGPSASFKKGNSIKWELFLEKLEAAEDDQILFHSDTDVEFNGPISKLVTIMDMSSMDIMFQMQNEGCHENHIIDAMMRWKVDANIGFMFVRKNERTLRFATEILEIMKRNRSLKIKDNSEIDEVTNGWDQMVVNEWLANPENPELRWMLAPTKLVGTKGAVFTHFYMNNFGRTKADLEKKIMDWKKSKVG